MGAKDTKVIMVVDTKNIEGRNAEQYVEFKDNRGNSKPSRDPANFISKISPGQKVFWFGEPKEEPRDTIEIIEITRKHEDEPEFLETKGRDTGHRGVFMAKVKDNYIEGLESYNVTFRIKGRETDFVVDPKLQMELKI